MKLSDYIKVEDCAKTFSFYVGKEIKVLRVIDSMVGFRFGQFFFTKRLGSIHTKEGKKKKKKKNG